MSESVIVDNDWKPDYSEDGVDLSQIRWVLSLTPAERLQLLESSIADVMKLRKLNG
jgi:hypothetical protein